MSGGQEFVSFEGKDAEAAPSSGDMLPYATQAGALWVQDLAGASVEMRVDAAIDAVAKLGCGFDGLESLLRDTATDKDAPTTRRRYLPRERHAGLDRIDNSLRQEPLPIRPRSRRRPARAAVQFDARSIRRNTSVFST